MAGSDKEAKSDNQRKVAVLFIGNKGVGKSALLNQLGGKFKSGFSFIEGVTRDVKEEVVKINGQQIILMDSPGLYEYDDAKTKENGKKLTAALRKGYLYKLFFVVGGNSRGISSEDLALMSRVNEAIRKTNKAKIEFRLIINQIRGDIEFEEYESRPLETFREELKRLNERAKPLSFDIHIEEILLLRHDESAINNRGFSLRLVKSITGQEEAHIEVDDINPDFNDISIVRAALSVVGIVGASILGFFVAPEVGIFALASVVITNIFVKIRGNKNSH